MAAVPPPVELGVHCAYPSCKTLDFLPLTCHHCSSVFCASHSSTSAHSCSSDPSLVALPVGEAKRTADQSGPQYKDLLPDPKRHKREEVVLSAEEQAKKDKQAAALEKLRASLAKSKPALSAVGGVGAAAPKKISPAVALMKLKQRAKPLDPKHVKREGDVPMLERTYFSVRCVEGGESEEKDAWVGKYVSAGKALDLLATLFKLNNVNNTTTDSSKLLSLAVPPSPTSQDPPTRIVLSEPLSAQIPNGGSILLLKGYPWSD